jgi:hypothetical protein
MKSFRSYLTAGVGFAMLVTIIFLSTGWGSAVAAQITNVFVTNDAAHAVPVREQGTVVVQQAGTPVHFVLAEENQQFPTYTVPAGKRLQIQYIKGSFATGPDGGNSIELGSGTFDQAYLGTPDGGGGFDIDEQVTIYLGPGESLTLHTPEDEGSAYFSFFGILSNA